MVLFGIISRLLALKLNRLWVILVFLLLLLPLPTASQAAVNNFTESAEPWEKVLSASGSWETQYAKYEGQTFLLVQYRGKRTPVSIDASSSPPHAKVSLKSEAVLRKIYIPLVQTSAPQQTAQPGQPDRPQPQVGPVTITLKDSRGNLYGPFTVGEVSRVGSGPGGYPIYYDAVWVSEGNVILPAGNYELTIQSTVPPVRSEEAGTFPAVLLTGVDYAAQKSYEEEVAMYLLRLQKLRGSGSPPAPQGLQQQMSGEGGHLSTSQRDGLQEQKPGGSGPPPAPQSDGLLSVAESQELLTAPEKQRFNFTGTYYINLDVVRTGTLMGPTRETKPSFTLRDYELTVLDQGDSLQIIGRYEDIPFSLEAEVVGREENRLEAILKGSTWLGPLPENIKRLNQSLPSAFKVRLPEPAQVSATINLTLEKPPGLSPAFKATGQGFYHRPYVPGKGADFNTYNISANGLRAKRELPAFVMAAMAQRLGSAGNIPGPDTPFQAAAGMLFPPLVAVLAQIVESYYRRKVEEARAAFEKLKQENPTAAALLVWAEAVPDPAAGDGKDVVGAVQEGDESYGEDVEVEETEAGVGEYGAGEEEAGREERAAFTEIPLDPGANFFANERERLMAERDEWLHNLKVFKKSADPDDPRAQELLQEYDRYIGYLNERVGELDRVPVATRTLVLPVDHTGRTAEVAYDPETGQWYNTETGNIFDMGRYEKDVLPNLEKDREFIETQRHKLETRDTAFDRAMDQLVNDHKERQRLLGQLQKIRNQAYGIEPPAPGVGDVNAHIDRLISDLSNMEMSTEELRDRAGRVARVVTGRFTGRTISEEEGRRLGELYTSTASILAHTAVESGLDVVTDRTWAGMAGRVTLAALTGGYSEISLSVGEALYDIKESIEAGESGARATLKAMGKYALGELAGAYGEEFLKHSGLKLNPEAMENLSKKLNTPVGELLWGKQGKEIMEGTVEKACKGLAGSTDSLARRASDSLDYVRYRGEVRDTAEMIAGKIRAGSELDVDDLRRVLRDPSVTRELKNAPEEVKRAYQNALEKNLYDPAISNTRSRLNDALNSDSAFKARLEKEYGPGTKVEVEIISIRTPGTPTEGIRLNADNDLSARIKITDANGQPLVDDKGNLIIRELKLKEVAGVYNERFARASGMLDAHGNFNVAKAQAEMPDVNWHQLTREQQLEVFAKRHNQEVTDVFSPEAAVDFSKWAEHPLRKDLPGGTSAVDLLKAGDPTARLMDPQGLAMMETYKIQEFFNRGGLANHTEAYEQLAKMGKLTGELTEAYRKLGFPVQDMPENMAKALEIVSNRNLSPDTRTLGLKELGFDGPVDLANKLAGRIEGLQKLSAELGSGAARGTGAGTSERTVRAVIAAVLRSYLKEKQ